MSKYQVYDWLTGQFALDGRNCSLEEWGKEEVLVAFEKRLISAETKRAIKKSHLSFKMTCIQSAIPSPSKSIYSLVQKYLLVEYHSKYQKS